MKLLVCVSKTPETTAKIGFTNENTEFDESGVSFIMNPYDEWYALVRALELKESAGGEVVVLNVGPASNDQIIRKALAIGADKAVRIDAETGSAGEIAKYIADHAKEESYDAIFLGKETIDYNGSEVGGMLAEHLDMPFLSYASHMEVDGSTAKVTRDIEGGTELVEVDFPFVISASKGLAEQRIPNMRGIMMAKRKPLDVVQPDAVEGNVKIESFSKPETKSDCTYVEADEMDKLVQLLREEAKVI